MSRFHSILLSSACGFAIAASPAVAQDASSSAAGANSDADTIIVTARRQNERLQDVPASVAVITADALQRTGAVKAEDFVKLTPGVTIVTGTAEAGDTQINIRGINGARDAESSVALVVDGILKTNTAQLNQPQGTLQQVEMLKGPQGAIYGRNAAAGAIVLQTLKPTDTITDVDPITDVNEPLCERSFFHGGRKGRHLDCDGHLSSSDEKFGCSFNDGIGIKTIRAVKVGQVSSLPKAVDTQRTDPHSTYSAQPRQRAR